MAYRFLKVQTTDRIYSQPFLLAHPEHKRLSYNQLFDLYLKEYSGWITNYGPNLKLLGNEALEVCINLEELQKKWAKEHAVSYQNGNWFRDIFAAQLKDFRPDILFLDDLYLLDRGFRQFVREVCPTKVKIVGWRAAPTEDYSIFRDLDLVLTCTPLFARMMQTHGANAQVIIHAFESEILNFIETGQERDIDFSFIGHFVLRNGFHNERLSLVENLMDTTNLSVWGMINEVPKNTVSTRVAYKLKRGVDKAFGLMGMSEKAPALIRGPYRGPVANNIMRKYGTRFQTPVFGEDYFKVLARSKINLNKHIDCAEEFAGNLRLFEATGMGSCLITDWKINLPEMFEPDAEIVTYKSADECREKVRYLLDHERERKEIARCGQRRVMRDHTYRKRAEQLDEIFRKLL
jgi:spore maturation protein CgeB